MTQTLNPSKLRYGQNQFNGASSDLPGESTVSGFLPAADLAGARAADKAVRDRTVSATPYPPSYGMTQRVPRGK